MRIRAPAKINLSLRVVGRRRDGYHLVDTVLVPVSLYDDIEITRPKRARQALSVVCDHPLVPSGKKNLAYRAAALLLKQAGVRAPIRIRIRKRIPVGAGLGGGSSDAAATLVGLNRLLRLGWGRKRLLPLAGSLGADVPFFILGKPARGRGIGDKLSAIGPIRRLWLGILYPGFPVSTRWAYGRLPHKLTKHIENTSINLSSRGRAVSAALLVNDLEKVVFQRYSRVARLKERLIQEGAASALMSGSGSSVFGIFVSRRQAAKALLRLRKEVGVQAYLVRSLN
jgi:4-diphosphocytidyl-2-C-methyl-D-erythritol kinase